MRATGVRLIIIIIQCTYRSDLPALEEIGTEAAMRTLDLLGGKKIPTSKIPVIIENRGAGNVLNGLFSPISAGSIQQKRSFLAEKKGKSIGSRLMTMVDDPFIPRGSWFKVL